MSSDSTSIMGTPNKKKRRSAIQKLLWATSGLLYQHQMIGEGDCGAIGGMKIGKGNRSTRRKPVPAPLCPPQIPLDQTRDRKPGRRGGKPATNRLSYGVAPWFYS
jgi:hypothetical protein